MVCKFFTYQLLDYDVPGLDQRKWPGVGIYQKWSATFSLFMPLPGWNCAFPGEAPTGKPALPEAAARTGPMLSAPLPPQQCSQQLPWLLPCFSSLSACALLP